MAELKDMLVYYRKRDGLSQRELASKVGVSPSTIGMYESGKRFPERSIEEALADIFNVSLSSLRGIDEDENLPRLNAEEMGLIDSFRSLNGESKRQIILMLSFLKEQEKQQNIKGI